MLNCKESETIPMHKTRARESLAAKLAVTANWAHV